MALQIISYSAILSMGLVLGLMGAGGSIMTVPILVYLFGFQPSEATSYSLFIVGMAAGVGAVKNFRLGQINFKVSIYFALPSLVGVYLARHYFLPSLPPAIHLSSLALSKDTFIMLLFALLMLGSSYFMLRPVKPSIGEKEGVKNLKILPLQGLSVGLLTGFVGAGGGFLIIPALVLLAGLEMKVAVGTSLFIILVNSMMGVVGDLLSGIELRWSFLLLVSLIAMFGIYLGSHLQSRFKNDELRKYFSIFVLLIGSYVLIDYLLKMQAIG